MSFVPVKNFPRNIPFAEEQQRLSQYNELKSASNRRGEVELRTDAENHYYVVERTQSVFKQFINWIVQLFKEGRGADQTHSTRLSGSIQKTLTDRVDLLMNKIERALGLPKHEAEVEQLKREGIYALLRTQESIFDEVTDTARELKADLKEIKRLAIAELDPEDYQLCMQVIDGFERQLKAAVDIVNDLRESYDYNYGGGIPPERFRMAFETAFILNR